MAPIGRYIAAAAFMISIMHAWAAPPREFMTLEEQVERSCRVTDLALVGRVSNLKTVEPERRDVYPLVGERQVADLTVIELIKGSPAQVPRTVRGRKRVTMLSDQMGVELEEGKTYLFINGSPPFAGQELLRFQEFYDDEQLGKYTDTRFRRLVEIARKTCGRP